MVFELPSPTQDSGGQDSKPYTLRHPVSRNVLFIIRVGGGRCRHIWHPFAFHQDAMCLKLTVLSFKDSTTTQEHLLVANKAHLLSNLSPLGPIEGREAGSQCPQQAKSAYSGYHFQH